MSVTKVTGMMQTSTKGGDISSASPTVIDTDGDYFDVTGTTNFAAFTVAAGRRFTVQFDGVLTMTHHATTLDLPGGANITTAAGDVAEFFATGTNTVQCVNYTKADGTAVVAAGGGAWTILATTAASGASSIDFTNVTSTYDTYVMVISDMICSADGNGINFRFGDSGGFDSGGSDYQSHEMRPLYTSGNTYAGSNGDGSQIGLSHALGTGTGEGYGGILYIHQPSDGVTMPMVSYHSATYNYVGSLYLGFGAGARVSNIVMDRFQIYPAGGTLTGRATVYGIAHA